MRCPKHKDRRAFTLMELLVVILVIAGLVAIAIPFFGTLINNALVRADISNIRSGYTFACMEVISKPSSDVKYFGLNEDGSISKPNEDGNFCTLGDAARATTDSIDIGGQNITPWNAGDPVYYSWDGYRIRIRIEAYDSLGNPTVLAKIKNVFNIWNTSIDSNEDAFDESKGRQFNENLAAEGLTMRKMKAETWHYDPQGFLYWTDRSIKDSDIGAAVPCIMYNYNTGAYTVRLSNVTNGNCAEAKGESYKVLSGETTAYEPDATLNAEAHTFENAQKLLAEAQRDYA